MQRLFDTQSQQWMEVPDEQVAEGVASGRYQYDTRVSEVPVFSPTGERGSVPADKAAEAYRQGYTPATVESSSAAFEREKADATRAAFEGQGPGGASLTALAGGVLSGFTGGLSDVILRAGEEGGVLPEGITEARAISRAVNPGSGITGEIGGLVSPASAFGKVAGGATKALSSAVTRAGAGAVERTTATLGKGAFEGALYSVPAATSTAVLGDPDDAAEALLSTLQEGAELGGALSGLGIVFQATRPLAGFVTGKIGEFATKASQKTVKTALPSELKSLAEDVALREAALSPEMTGFAKAVDRADDSILGVQKKMETELRRGLDVERGLASIEAREAGEQALAADRVVREARTTAREDAAARLSDLATTKSSLQRQIAETRSMSREEARKVRRDLSASLKEISKQERLLQRELADNQAALRSSFKFETAEAQQGAEELLRANANDIIAARAKAAEVKNAKYAEMNKWKDPTDPHLDDVKVALHSPVDPDRLFETVQRARAAAKTIGDMPFKTNRMAADNINGILQGLVGEAGLAAKDSSSMIHFMPSPKTGLDLFNAEYLIKQQIGGIYGKTRNPGPAVNQLYNEFRDKIFKDYGELGRVANEASDAFRVYHGFREATKAIKTGNESVAVLRRLYTDPEKSKAVDAVSMMIADGVAVPEFQRLAKARINTKEYFAALDALNEAIRREHVAASSARLPPESILSAGEALNQAPLAARYAGFESTAAKLAATETKVASETARLAEQRAALEAQRRAATPSNPVPPDLEARLSQIDQQLVALRQEKRNPFVPESLLDQANIARQRQQALTARNAGIHDDMVRIANDSPTFRLDAEDMKMLADKWFPGGRVAKQAADAVAFKDGYAKLVADGASPIDKYFYMLRNTGGDITKEMDRLATALPYYQAIEAIEKRLSSRDLTEVIGRRVGRGVVGSVIGTAISGPIGGLIGGGVGSLLSGGTNPAALLRTLSSTEKAIAGSRKAIDIAMKKAADAFHSTAARKVATPLYVAPNKTERQKTVRAAVAQITALANPTTLADVTGKATADLPPEIASAVARQYAERVRFLLTKIPVDPIANKYPLANSITPTYPESQIRSFERYLAASEDPLKVIERIGQGAATPEEIETLKTLYPRQWSALKINILSAVATNPNLSYQQRILLGSVFEVTTDPTLDPGFMGRLYQSEFVRLAQQEQASQGAAGEPRTKISNARISADMETPTQRVTEGMDSEGIS